MFGGEEETVNIYSDLALELAVELGNTRDLGYPHTIVHVKSTSESGGLKSRPEFA